MNYKSRNQSNDLMNNITVRVVMPPQKKPAKRRRPQSSQLQAITPKQQILSSPQPANFLYGNPQVPMGQQNLPQGLYYNPPIPPTFNDGTQVLFNEPVAEDISDITAEMSQGLQFQNEMEIQRNFYEADMNRVFIEQQEEEQRARINAQRALEDISREPSMLSDFLSENRPMMVELATQTEEPRFMSVSTETEQPRFMSVGTETEQPRFMSIGTETEEPEQPRFMSIGTETEQPRFMSIGTETEEPPFMSVGTETEESPFMSVGTETEEPPFMSIGTEQDVRGLEPSFTFEQPQSIFSLTELPLESQLQTVRQRIVEPVALAPRNTLSDLISGGSTSKAIEEEPAKKPSPLTTLGMLGDKPYQKMTIKQLDSIGKRIQDDTGRKSNPLRKLNKDQKISWIMENGYEKYLS